MKNRNLQTKVFKRPKELAEHVAWKTKMLLTVREHIADVKPDNPKDNDTGR